MRMTGPTSLKARTLVLFGLSFSLAIPAGARTINPTIEDQPQSSPVSLELAAKRVIVPEGFKVTLFAGEPDVRQPIAFTIDDRGRLWVVECYSYPNWMPGAVRGQDRVVVFEDEDSDGRFDRRTVFLDKGDNLTGIELGFGGVWLCATPNLIFIPDRNADDVPDGEPEIVLDGWDPNCRHNAFNALNWGPDGWLYGCNGILSNSKVGRPGTPDADRVAINCGVWRYHPTKKIFEAVAHGTTNPWGLDFDDYGEMFITNCVIPHLFHVVPGAHFQRMFGQDINPHSYDLMKSCADHIHWGGGDWTSSRGGQGIHSVAGGGHAHAGAMIYLGDNWPDRYRDSVFTINIHGRRVNNDKLTRSGSGYVATHENDFLFSGDEWFRGLELKYGPDGGVYVTDWSDTGECHDYDSVHGVHRDSGRIFKVTHGASRGVRVDLAKLSDAELVELQLHKNDWYVRHTRRMLQERAAAGHDMKQVQAELRKILDNNEDVTRKLRALWALHVTGGTTTESLFQLLGHDDEHVRGWAVRLLCEPKGRLPQTAGTPVFGKFIEMATSDPSPLSRLQLAAALQRIPPEQCWPIASALVTHAEDADDPNLPLMLYYGIEPLVGRNRATAASLAGRCQIPLVRRFLARRIVLEPERAASDANDVPAGLGALTHVLGHTNDSAIQNDLLTGILDALAGRKRVPMPRGWPALYESLVKLPEARENASVLAVKFGDPAAIASLEKAMMDDAATADLRRQAVQCLAENGVPNLTGRLHELLDDAAVRGAAIRALASCGDDTTPPILIRHYASFIDTERSDAVATLATRPGHARAMLEAVTDGTIPSRDLSVYVVRQLRAFKNADIDRTLNRVWGTVRSTSADKAALMAKYQAALTPSELEKADRSNGRAVYGRTCAQCHRLFGEGGDAGPDLTGSNRDNLDFILENVLDPSAVVGRDYKLTTIATKDGRLISGIIRSRFDKALVVQTPTDRITLATDDIEEMKESSVSMMPEGLFENMTATDLRDLVAYLATKAQVPIRD